MGNAESQGQIGHHSRRRTPTNDHERKQRSLSPNKLNSRRSDSLLNNKEKSVILDTQNSSSSFHFTTTDSQQQTTKHRIQQRRAKSFRAPNRRVRAGSFRVSVCHVTGLTDNQKQLIQQRWFELDRQGILDFGRKVFETVFNRDKRFLRTLGLAHLSDKKLNAWRDHVNFRVHTGRFCDTLNTVIRQLDDPEKVIGMLYELGALHLSHDKEDTKAQKLNSFWDGLIFAINNAAKDLQVESSRGSESPRNTYDKRFLLPGDDLSLSTPSASPSPTPFCLGPSTPRRHAVCPTAAEAWNVLSAYVVNQMKFGFEMERLLQSELRRLVANSVQCSWQTTSSDENIKFPPSFRDAFDGLSIQTKTTVLHGGGSISSTSNSSNSSSGSSANVYTTELPTTVELIPNRMTTLVE